MEWKINQTPVPYEDAVSFMEERVRQIRAAEADECIWLLEHPPLYTAGTSAKSSDLLDTLGFPVYQAGRGGQYTYHGPGQRIAYIMLDLKRRTPDIRLFVHQMEQWIIHTLAAFGVTGERREGRVGIWVQTPCPPLESPSRLREGLGEGSKLPPSISPRKRGEKYQGEYQEAKIAALGVRVRQWVTYHGISINVNPDLTHYRGIVPCGIQEYGVTSLADLGVITTMDEIDKQLQRTFDSAVT